MRRLARATLACLTLIVATGCRTPLAPRGSGPPPFPPNLPTEVSTESGLVFRATGEVLSTGPTTIRITATVENRTGGAAAIATLGAPCELIVIASWEHSPFIRIVDPLDGLGSGPGPLGQCARFTQNRTIADGEILELVSEDIVLSELLRSTFVEGGRYVLSAVFVDTFLFEVLAMDVTVQD
jgi:hypothetical protein